MPDTLTEQYTSIQELEILQKPLNISEMTEEQFNEEMDKAYQSILRGEGVPAEEAFARIKRAK